MAYTELDIIHHPENYLPNIQVDNVILGYHDKELRVLLQQTVATRKWSITGGYVALVDAVNTLVRRRALKESPIHGQVAAVSVGIWSGMPVLDLDYKEDSDAETDMNVVMNNGGGFIEVQGTAEGHAFRRDELDALLNLAANGIGQLLAKQLEALNED